MIVFLIGMMGSGKSSIGKVLAKSMGYYFIDMDEYIEKTAGMKINAIFEEKGEEHFRLLESQALNELKYNQNTVISAGGGTPAYHGNMDTMLTFGRVIYLKVDIKELFNRLLRKHEHRPLIKGLDNKELENRLANLIANRESIYNQAHNIYKPQGDLEQDSNNIKQLVFSILN